MIPYTNPILYLSFCKLCDTSFHNLDFKRCSGLLTDEPEDINDEDMPELVKRIAERCEAEEAAKAALAKLRAQELPSGLPAWPNRL